MATLWECPNCVAVAETADPRTITPMHTCGGLSGMTAPFLRIPPGKVEIPAGVRVRAVEREDYIAGETVQVDGERRPIMSVITERPDGSNDIHVMAPSATATLKTGE